MIKYLSLMGMGDFSLKLMCMGYCPMHINKTISIRWIV